MSDFHLDEKSEILFENVRNHSLIIDILSANNRFQLFVADKFVAQKTFRTDDNKILLSLYQWRQNVLKILRGQKLNKHCSIK